MSQVVATLPYPPSINNYYCRSRIGVYIKQSVRQYRKDVAIILHGQHKFCENQVELHIDMYPRSKRKHDIDNILKAIFDAIQHAGIIDDDNQIVKLTVEKKIQVPKGRIDVILKAAT